MGSAPVILRITERPHFLHHPHSQGTQSHHFFLHGLGISLVFVYSIAKYRTVDILRSPSTLLLCMLPPSPQFHTLGPTIWANGHLAWVIVLSRKKNGLCLWIEFLLPVRPWTIYLRDLGQFTCHLWTLVFPLKNLRLYQLQPLNSMLCGLNNLREHLT